MHDCDYVDAELVRYREQEEARQAAAAAAYHQRRRQRKEEYEYSLRRADDWYEALQKQRNLCQREAREDDLEDDLFRAAAEACDFALARWDEIEKSKQPAIADLEARIEAIRNSIRLEVAAAVQAKNASDDGWKFVADGLANGGDPSAWLDW